MIFYDWSGGMESSAMLVLDRERILSSAARVRWADTGKHFPEMYSSKDQIERVLGLEIVTVKRRITFDEFLFDRGGMLRKGMTDCSRRMKRSNLSRDVRHFCGPKKEAAEINLGFNAGEQERADAFVERNERPWCHWRFPLIEASISREDTWEICQKAGFTILVEMYEKMGRLDCYWCPNQKLSQAQKVIEHYPDLAEEWERAEKRKGHSFLPIPLSMIRDGSAPADTPRPLGCSCFGGTDDVWEEDQD